LIKHNFSIDIFQIGNIFLRVSVIEADPFAALADPRRRRLLEALVPGEQRVTQLVLHLGIRQPEVSKHLNVLRSAGLVNARKLGRERLYSVNGARMKTVQSWVQMFERFWDHQLLSIKAHAEARQAAVIRAQKQSSKGESHG
jgi:DNA-binding transcriptional ArsR family regulator